MENILKKICKDKRIFIEKEKKKKSINFLIKNTSKKKAVNDFKKAFDKNLKKGKIPVISEIKKKSPSQGKINKFFNPIKIAKKYQKNGATCLSILTDEKYFDGSLNHLKKVRKITRLPILRKDFIVDNYQIIESKYSGVDCILLIMAALEKNQAKELETTAREYGLNVLLEVHNNKELEQALELKSKFIGINNRNLKTLKVNINNTKKLIKHIPKNKYVISESGIKSIDDMINLWSYGIKGFLIGETLLKNQSKLKDFLNVKTN
ncbi:MAG: indole-3-glycerol-phosphate synthase [Pelagibacteraceae bacterium]|nr:indole-3-glycerol-phosphate synthase [Pelagibacteraceae bacterium]PPR32977.1 MAG: Indole-3-glycerol phosphate synthase [Alphaproteobacteria bacterium MarineAlpha6_Bin5]|tara:strand:+ start:309 stop:1100 length:792 start_codon:yes stop_codon:yes gene_type:complete